MHYFMILVTFLSYSVFGFETGEKIPDFEAQAIDKKITLSQFRGKTVILEWLNHGCPFVRKHYDSGNMQKLQKKYTDKKVIWLSIISSASGKQGHVDQAGALKDKKENKSFASEIILDTEGKLGKMFEAKTTPHLFIINKDGILAYQGAIDDRADADIESVPLAKNYISLALDEILSGKKVSNGTTRAYGCSVKY